MEDLAELLEDLEEALEDESVALYDQEVEGIRTLIDRWDKEEWKEKTGEDNEN